MSYRTMTLLSDQSPWNIISSFLQSFKSQAIFWNRFESLPLGETLNGAEIVWTRRQRRICLNRRQNRSRWKLSIVESGQNYDPLLLAISFHLTYFAHLPLTLLETTSHAVIRLYYFFFFSRGICLVLFVNFTWHQVTLRLKITCSFRRCCHHQQFRFQLTYDFFYHDRIFSLSQQGQSERILRVGREVTVDLIFPSNTSLCRIKYSGEYICDIIFTR